jgi:hypothetical protein
MTKKTIQTVKGHTLRAPHLTRMGYRVIAQQLIAPLLGGLLALDILIYVIFRYGFHQCYGVLCLW